MKKAQYFITCGELAAATIGDMHPDLVRKVLIQKKPQRKGADPGQLALLFPDAP